jgi:glyoxylase-like metal-dependent hydrolase (beta-lactamase superfamily II)
METKFSPGQRVVWNSGFGYWDKIDKKWWDEIACTDSHEHTDHIEGKQQLIERLLGEKAAKDNSVDLNAYALGLSDMYDKMESIN